MNSFSVVDYQVIIYYGYLLAGVKLRQLQYNLRNLKLVPKVHQTVHVHAGLVLISERDCQSQLFYFVVFKVRYFLLGVLVVFA